MSAMGSKISIRWDVVHRFWWPAVVTSVLHGLPSTVGLRYVEGYGYMLAVRRRGSSVTGDAATQGPVVGVGGGASTAWLDDCCRNLLDDVNNRLSEHVIGRRGRATVSVAEMR